MIFCNCSCQECHGCSGDRLEVDLRAQLARAERIEEAARALLAYAPWITGAAKGAVDTLRAALSAPREDAHAPGVPFAALDWPNRPFRFHDDPGEHDPCYVVTPGGEMLPFNHHATPGVDVARARWIVDACNAALSAPREDARAPTHRSPLPLIPMCGNPSLPLICTLAKGHDGPCRSPLGPDVRWAPAPVGGSGKTGGTT